MANKIANRVKMTVASVASSGTGDITLGSSVPGYLTFAEGGVSNADTVPYVLEAANGDWEIGVGTYTSTGTVLARTTVTKSSIGGTVGTSKITASSTTIVMISPLAADLQAGTAAGNLVQLDGNASIPVSNGGTGLTSLTAGYIPYGNGTGAFGSSSGFVFDGSNLTVAGLITANNGGTFANANLHISGQNITATDGSGYWAAGASTYTCGWYGSSGAMIFRAGGSSERARIDASGNLGLGVTPSAWSFAGVAQIKNASVYGSGTQEAGLYANAYYNGGWKYIAGGQATGYVQNNGHQWFVAGTGSAAGTISFTQAMTLDASGNLYLGSSGASYTAANRGNITIGGGTNGSILAFQTGGVGKGFLFHDGSNFQLLNDTNNPIIFATNSTERARIDASGNVGIGTSSPGQKLDVNGIIQSNSSFYTKSSTGYPGYYMSNASGTVVGNLNWDASNSRIVFEARSTYPFTIFTNSNERMRIDASGNLLVGTTSASDSVGVGMKLIYSATAPEIAIVASASTSATAGFTQYSTGAGAYRFYVDNAGTIHATATSIAAISDISLKENIRPIETGLSEILSLSPRRFDWKNGDGINIAGFIAQEVEQVLPDLVSDYKYNETDTKKAIKMGDMMPTVVRAIQELAAKVSALEARI